MRYEVRFTLGAKYDVEQLHAYMAETAGTDQAERLLDRLVEAIESLAAFPERGAHPKELLAFGFRDFRQMVVHPDRIIYRVLDHQVFVDLIADGRRDMQTLLARRLL